MATNDSAGYSDSTDFKRYRLGKELGCYPLDYRLSFTIAEAPCGTEVVIINGAKWRRFVKLMEDYKRAEAGTDNRKSNLVYNISLVSRLDDLERRLETISNEQNQQLREKDLQNNQLEQEL